jgi:hypothetical protein
VGAGLRQQGVLQQARLVAAGLESGKRFAKPAGEAGFGGQHARLCRIQTALGLALLGAPGRLLQRNGHADHHFPVVRGVVGAVVGQADGEIRITVQPGQFATLLRGNDAEAFARDLRRTCADLFEQALVGNSGGGWRQLSGLGERGIAVPRQQGIELGGVVALATLGFDEIDLDAGQFALRPQGVLLRHQTDAVAGQHQLLDGIEQRQGLAEDADLARGLELPGVGGLDAVLDLEHGAILQGLDLLGERLGDFTAQLALAPERQRLDDPVAGIAHLARQQRRRTIRIHGVGEVHQFEFEARIGQCRRRLDPFPCRFRLEFADTQLGVVLAGIAQQTAERSTQRGDEWALRVSRRVG